MQGLPAMLAVNPELLAGFIVAVVVLILMPGPIVTLVVANSLSYGQRIGLATVAGSSSGNALLVAAGALGLTTLLALASELFEVLRWARSEEHTSELQSLMRISYAVFCLKKKKNKQTHKQS